MFSLASAVAPHYDAGEMPILRTTLAKLSIVFAILVAMAGTGLAHRAIPLNVDQDLVSYMAAGGLPGEICGDDSGEHVAQSCDSCRIVDGAWVPPVTTRIVAVALNSVVLLPAAIADFRTFGVADPSRPVRAPPIV